MGWGPTWVGLDDCDPFSEKVARSWDLVKDPYCKE
jgi:hypothetical protein